MSVIDDEDFAPVKKAVQKPVVTTQKTTITQKYGVEKPKVGSTSTIQTPVQKPKEDVKVPVVNVGDFVYHKIHGKGTVSFMDKAQKRLRVDFKAGEKVFPYPEAFLQGHLKTE